MNVVRSDRYKNLTNVTSIKKKRKRAVQRELDIISGKQRVKKVASEKENILLDLLRKKITGERGISEYLEGKNISTNPQEVKWLDTLVSLKFDLRTLSIWPNLFSKPIKYRTYTKFKIKSISADKLLARYYQNTALQGVLEKCCDVDRVGYYSQDLIVLEDEQLIYEYYIEDFSLNLSGVYYNSDKKENYKLQEDKLKIRGEDYSFATTNDVEDVVIFKDSVYNTLGDAMAKLDEQVRIKNESGLKQGIREYKYSPGNYYMNQDVILTDVFPPVLVLPNPYEFTVVFEGTINVENYIESYKRKEEENINSGLISIENLEPIMNLIGVAGLIDNRQFQTSELTYSQVYEYYWKNKAYFQPLKGLYSDFKNIVLYYMESFSIRVSIDRMRKTFDACENWLQRWNQYLNSKSNKICADFLGYISGDNTFKNFQLFSKNIIDVIKVASETCINPNSLYSDAIEKTLRAAALAITNILIDGSKCIIGETRSPYSFLGNTIGSSEQANALITYAQMLIENSSKETEKQKEVESQKNTARNIGKNEGMSVVYDKLIEKLNDPKLASPEILAATNEIGSLLGKNPITQTKATEAYNKAKTEEYTKLMKDINELSKNTSTVISTMSNLQQQQNDMTQKFQEQQQQNIQTQIIVPQKGFYGFVYNMKLSNFILYNPQNSNNQFVYYSDISSNQTSVNFNSLGTNKINIMATPGTADNPIFTILDLLLAITIYYDGQDVKNKQVKDCTWINILNKTNDVNARFNIPNNLLLFDQNGKEYKTKGNVNILEVINKMKPNNEFLVYYTDSLNNNILVRPTRYQYYSHSLNPFYLNLDWENLFKELEYPPEIKNDIINMYNSIRNNE